jgi:hypothetical protein
VPEEVTKWKSKRRRTKSNTGGLSLPAKSTEQADRRHIAEAEEQYGVRLGLTLTALSTDPLYTPVPKPYVHGLRRPHGPLARPLLWSMAYAVRSCGSDREAVAGLVSFKEIAHYCSDV